MKYRIIYIACLLSIIALSGQAQKEANNWFFGENAGVTWNTTQSMGCLGIGGTETATLHGLPTPYPTELTIPINLVEGSFSLSDPNGNLLCFSDGMTIWDNSLQEMPNGTGLTGHHSSAQSGIIIPFPGHIDQYIVVTVSEYVNNNLSYSIVDMRAEGNGTTTAPLGDVISKNNLFQGHLGKTGEVLTSVKHANGEDYWVVAAGRDISPTYLNAWLVSASGVSSTPVTTAMPFTNTFKTIGAYITFSPDGKYFAWATAAYQHLVFGEFDTATGVFSNVKKVEYDGSNISIYPYGVSFSPSGKYLYVGNVKSLKVYDFANLLADISTEPLIYNISNVYALQLGPDWRIYAATAGSGFVVVDNPEEYGNLKLYRANVLKGGTSSKWGLPSFSPSWWSVSISVDKTLPICSEEALTFTTILNISGIESQITKIVWDFGDGTVKEDTNISSSQYSYTHKYTKPGTYALTVIPYAGNNPITDRIKVLQVPINPCVMPVNPNIHLY
ncbi:hypothetical protein M2459_001816 [Parabacteroides sp. PF5-5]|uniref:PKD domain-containing protein n=1 Tax=unclassified Parabacteroides TaxID=2649774 RepID=UPI002476E66F|nr:MULTISPECIES: PKD domain-containing protein [unclassified Parabacteroides]MDH6305079.1 hypothetical protein [Parabacteroides sp. PH5-39]MDH6315836.1 hypothetical protein [Parabacteroides sp. PF5-13]MDH6319493.1 hypothetical protein [Parabacteroides sp. PH5-13]MDH6323224.1 hypothetical protein [Parabacteroides sp. PH5-8]MDH6327268.1 hypothetical protein [Parabacteroides sp. PH5-41]